MSKSWVDRSFDMRLVSWEIGFVELSVIEGVHKQFRGTLKRARIAQETTLLECELCL